jgi:putative nucleotidyltransferase with HDIG domain
VTAVPSDDQAHFLALTLERDHAPMAARERLAEWVVGGGFAVCAAAILIWGPASDFDALRAILATVVFVVASRIRFEVVFGFTVPTQLALVPMLFVVPLNLIPVLVAASLAAARLPEIASGAMQASRLVHVLGNSWFTIGPVLVFWIAGVAPPDAGAVVLLLALLAQFVSDFAASSVRDGIASDVGVAEQLGETWVYAVDAALSPVALCVAELSENIPIALLAPLPLIWLLATFARERRQRLEGLIELTNAYKGTALLLGDVVEADDAYTARHSRHVVELSLAVSDHLGLAAHERRNLEFAALLHDVGKIAIPKEIINKPGALDPEEWDVVKTHTVEGQRMLERIGGFMSDVGSIVRSHHERWDGGGYPDGLAAEEIPLPARIIACCDSWNAMRTDRSYRNALPAELALTELEACSGSQFDPEVVAALIEVVGELEAPEDARQSRLPRFAAAPARATAR